MAALAVLPAWPAALDDVVAVGALDGHGGTADFSPDRPWVDIATRGVNLRSTFPDTAGFGLPTGAHGSWAEWSGTSFSTALVSGAIAAWIKGAEPFTARLNPDYPGYDTFDQLMRLDEWLPRMDEDEDEDE